MLRQQEWDILSSVRQAVYLGQFKELCCLGKNEITYLLYVWLSHKIITPYGLLFGGQVKPLVTIEMRLMNVGVLKGKAILRPCLRDSDRLS